MFSYIKISEECFTRGCTLYSTIRENHAHWINVSGVENSLLWLISAHKMGQTPEVESSKHWSTQTEAGK